MLNESAFGLNSDLWQSFELRILVVNLLPVTVQPLESGHAGYWENS